MHCRRRQPRGGPRPTRGSSSRALRVRLLRRRCPASRLSRGQSRETCGQSGRGITKKRGYLRVTAPWSARTGAAKNYRLERFFEPPPLRAPDLEPLFDRPAAAFRPDDFLPPDLRAADFFLPPDLPALFRAVAPFLAPDFLPPEDLLAGLEAFRVDPLEDPEADRLADPDPTLGLPDPEVAPPPKVVR